MLKPKPGCFDADKKYAFKFNFGDERTSLLTTSGQSQPDGRFKFMGALAKLEVNDTIKDINLTAVCVESNQVIGTGFIPSETLRARYDDFEAKMMIDVEIFSAEGS